VYTVKQPSQKFDRVPLLFQPKFSSAGPVHLLQKLVRANLAFEQSWIPDLLCKNREALDELGLLSSEVGQQQEISQCGDVDEGVYDHVHVIVSFDIVETDVPWHVGLRG
jgi:hypothetical protein